MKYKIVAKFNYLPKAKHYLMVEGYRFKESYSFKEDRCLIYKHKKYNKWLKVTSVLGYLNDTTTELGTVWNIEKI